MSCCRRTAPRKTPAQPKVRKQGGIFNQLDFRKADPYKKLRVMPKPKTVKPKR